MPCDACPVGPGCKGEKHRRLCEILPGDPALTDHHRTMAGLPPLADSPVRRADRAPRDDGSGRLVVVARYNEDVRWVNDCPLPVLVYNKGDAIPYLAAGVGVRHVPNRGREADTYLRFLVERHDDPPEWTYFVQGTPHNDSPADFFARLAVPYPGVTSLTREYSPDIPSREVKDRDLVERHGGHEVRYGLVAPHDPGYCDAARLPADRLWSHFFAGPRPEPFVFPYAAQLAVPRAAVRARPAEFWRWCWAECGAAEHASPGHVASAWAFEMLWLYLFDPRHPVHDRYRAPWPPDRPAPPVPAAPVPPPRAAAPCGGCGGGKRGPIPAGGRRWP